MKTEKGYVYDGVEVNLTGREAVRQIKLRTFKLVEIAPTDKTVDWRKWVSFDQLYEIRGEIKIEN